MSAVEAMQADTVLLDAEYFVPFIIRAFADAKTSGVPQLAAVAADPRVAQAVRRLGRWGFTTPTRIAAGYDRSVPAAPPPQRVRPPQRPPTRHPARRGPASSHPSPTPPGA